MTILKGIDFAWKKPSPDEAKKVGAHWVAGYISQDPTKDLTSTEIHQYVSAGLPAVLVYESTAARALQGMHAGIFDAQYALKRRAELGMTSAVIHFGVDTDADWNQVQPYFEGVHNQFQGMSHIGVYGGLRVIEGAYRWGIRYCWQTVAWSGGVWSPHATIRQELGTVFNGTADVDYSEQPDFGQWPRYVVPTPPVNNNQYIGEDVISYFDIPAGKAIDIPIEPTGSLATPQGLLRNGPVVFGGCPKESQNGVLKVWYHNVKTGWEPVDEHPVQGDADRLSWGFPTDGSIDKIRLECDVDFTAYIAGRQVQ